MASNKIYLTTEGLRSLEEEIEHLRNVRRPAIAEFLHHTKSVGEGENGRAEYEEATTAQDAVERRIQDVESLIHNAIIIPSPGYSNAKQHSSAIALGSEVRIQRVGGKNPEVYIIVASTEASPTQGKISNESPLGQALFGKSINDEVEFSVPAGIQRFKVLAVR
jgi:transcription elongation factor GreA